MNNFKLGMILVLLASFPVSAQTVSYCGEIKRLRVWADGSDRYGVWVEYQNNPERCPGGFYIKHEASNRDIVISTILSAKAMKEQLCIQVIHGNEIDNRCRLNYVMHKS